MPRLPSLLCAVLLLTASGCDEDSAEQTPGGAKGPLVLRVWDKQARAVDGAPPTTLLADRAEQRGSGEQVRLSPVLVRKPLDHGGVLYIHAERALAGNDHGMEIPEPLRLTGVWRGLPFTGTADRAARPSGGLLQCTNLRLVHGGQLTLVPEATFDQDRIDWRGPVSVAPGAPGITAALAALPPIPATPLLAPGDR